MPIPSSVMMALVAGSTRNSSAANFSTAVNGVASGTLSLLQVYKDGRCKCYVVSIKVSKPLKLTCTSFGSSNRPHTAYSGLFVSTSTGAKWWHRLCLQVKYYRLQIAILFCWLGWYTSLLTSQMLGYLSITHVVLIERKSLFAPLQKTKNTIKNNVS